MLGCYVYEYIREDLIWEGAFKIQESFIHISMAKKWFDVATPHSHLHNHPFNTNDPKILTTHSSTHDLLAEPLKTLIMKLELNGTATIFTIPLLSY